MTSIPRTLLLLLVGALGLVGTAPRWGGAQPTDTTITLSFPLPADSTGKDVPYVATPPRVVERMLEVAAVSEDDVVYDLGSGDGRIPIAAAQRHGARGVGVEIDSALVRRARANARKAGVADRVEFRQGDLFETDLGEATVVTLYLFPEVNLRLRPKLLLDLDPGDRVVSHDFDMGGWEPDRVVEVGRATIYLWTIPERIPDDLKPE